jgi:phage terminase Nu1 subunit (DNA packaging protein)
MKKHEVSRPRRPPNAEPPSPETAHRGPGRPASLHAARTRKEWALAELREIEVRRRRGELLDRDDVRDTWCKILRDVRARLLAVPNRVRSRLPHLTPADILVVDEEIRAALTALAKGETTTDAAGAGHVRGGGESSRASSA